ncbi:MAG: 2-C-methyl-D-erythritol 4-phosphate cytidylyltransferase [Deltaproteobacteria bacterium]|jgi:2-C-methyl-D-erythritol 4-phosphate cytidylyltransferase/2-C-methyl-D-erythritol 2,4-cyclodiphosphate synthase|nr:2-C-methyl-D-erythritol 4-phosphate cytidylyltransferase [Deltaproteobacteria bacterium]
MTTYDENISLQPRVGVIMAAAGTGERFGSPKGFPKTLSLLEGKPIIARAVKPFLSSPNFHSMVVAVPPGMVTVFSGILSGMSEKIIVVEGGANRIDSVKNALKALPPVANVVLVHDGARPLVSREVIENVALEAINHGAAIAAARANDTIKEASGDSEESDPYVLRTLDRKDIWRAQTPQGFKRTILEEALRKSNVANPTDEASLVEKIGHKVRLVESPEENMKITSREDLLPASAMAAALDRREFLANLSPDSRDLAPEAPDAMAAAARRTVSGLSVGQGFDFHRFAAGESPEGIALGMIRIPFAKKLEGHSDADVLTHAFIDALLGAGGLKDIGVNFPDRDEAHRGASGESLFRKTWDRLKDHFVFLYGDLTLFGEEPKIAPHADRILSAYSAILGVLPFRLNLKGKTTEKMGFLGRGEGLGASAVSLLLRKGPG